MSAEERERERDREIEREGGRGRGRGRSEAGLRRSQVDDRKHWSLYLVLVHVYMYNYVSGLFTCAGQLSHV